MEWYFASFRRYGDFARGRARRTEFWTFTLCNLLVAAALIVVQYLVLLEMLDIGSAVLNPAVASAAVLARTIGLYLILVATAVAWLVMILPTIGVTVRRLHDTGRSGWWVLVALVPVLGALVLLALCCLDSEPRENAFGLNPKLHPATAERLHVAGMG